MKIQYLLMAFFCLVNACFGLQTLFVENDNIYEVYEPQDEIPLSTLEEGLSMYFEAFLHPKLYEGISLEALQIDPSRYGSYEEFIGDMFRSQFESYRFSGGPRHFYLQARGIQDGKIKGVCVAIKQTDGSYDIHHIGTHKDFRREKIAYNLMDQLIKIVPDFAEISLDTRVFNKPAQFLYEKLGFEIEEINPNPKKQFTHFHYVLSRHCGGS